MLGFFFFFKANQESKHRKDQRLQANLHSNHNGHVKGFPISFREKWGEVNANGQKENIFGLPFWPLLAPLPPLPRKEIGNLMTRKIYWPPPGGADGGKGKDPRVADDETFVSDSQIPLSFPVISLSMFSSQHFEFSFKKKRKPSAGRET
jgi:hypothetical protein